MGFQTVNGLAESVVDDRGLIVWGSAPYDTISAAALNATLKDSQNADYYGLLPGVLVEQVLTATGLTLNVPVGLVYYARQVWVSAGTTTLLLPDNATSFVWLCADGVLRYTASASVYPTSFDGQSCALLARCVTLSGVVTTIDTSVRQYARRAYGGGRIAAENAAHWGPTPDSIPAGVTLVVPAGSQLWLFGSLSGDGVILGDGKVRVDA